MGMNLGKAQLVKIEYTQPSSKLTIVFILSATTPQLYKNQKRNKSTVVR